MKILITGCAGFLGRHCVAAAADRGWDVDGFDIAHKSESRRLDVRLLQRIEADVVLHLAAYSSNAGFGANIADNYATNVMGTWNVLRAARDCGARVVYASSSAVYEGSEEAPDSEENRVDAVSLNSHYAKSKLMCEMMAASFEPHPQSLGLRIFNAYGAGDELKRYQSPVTQFREAKATGRPMVIYGDGEQAKDFVHASDVVECIMRLIEAKATGIVNIGTGVATTFNTLADIVGCECEYAPVPNPESYQYYTRASTERLFSLIGTYKFKSVEEGLGL